MVLGVVKAPPVLVECPLIPVEARAHEDWLELYCCRYPETNLPFLGLHDYCSDPGRYEEPNDEARRRPSHPHRDGR